MKKMQTRVLVEASLLVALAAIIMILSVYVPFFALVGVIVWPIPITLLTFKYNIQTSLLSLVALLLIVAAIVDPLTAVSLGLLYGVPSVVLGFCLRKKLSPFITVISMALSMFVAYVVLIKLAAVITGVDIIKQMDEYFKKSRELMKGFGLTEEQIEKSLPQVFNADLIKMILPGILAMASVAGSYMNYYFVGIIFKKLKISISTVKPMEDWFISNYFSYGLFSITIFSWLMLYLKIPNAETVFNSIFVIFSFVFMINGLALLSWFLKKRGISKKLRIMILVGVYLTGMVQLLYYAGLLDYALDFRRINPARRRIKPGE